MDDNEKLLELNKIMNLINSPKTGDRVIFTIKGFPDTKFIGKIIKKEGVNGKINIRISSIDLNNALKQSKIPRNVEIDTIEHNGIEYNPNGIKKWKKL